MSKRIVCVLLSFVLVMISGCAKKGTASLDPKDTDVTTLLLRRDGSVQAVFVEEFEKDYYNKEEVRDFIDNAVDSYNKTAGEGAVSVETVDLDGSTMKADFRYKSFADFTGYGGINTQAGGLYTMNEAAASEILPDRMAAAGKDGEADRELIQKEEKAKVLTLEAGGELINITVEGTVLYYSGGVMLDSDTVQLTGEEAGIVVYK